MKKQENNLVIAAALFVALVIPAKALTIITTISSYSVSDTQALLLMPNESLAYSLTGTATGQVLIEKSINASEWSTTGITVTGAGSVSSSGTIYSGGRSTYYRIRRSTFSAGSLTTSLSDRDDLVTEFKNNKQQRILAINDDSVVVSGGFVANSSTFTSSNITSPSLSGAISIASGSTVTYTSVIVTGTRTDSSTTTFNGAVFNGSQTDSSTTTLSGAVINGTETNNSSATYTGTLTFNGATTPVILASGKRIALDGGGDSYFYENGDNLFEFVSGSTVAFRINGVASSLFSTLRIATGTTASLPSYTFVNDTNTGFWNPTGADTIGVVTGGTTRLQVDSSTFQVITGNFNVLAGYTKLYDRTLAQIQAIVPTQTGQIYACTSCTTTPLCISTGTVVNAFSSMSSKTTACQ